MGFSLFFLFLFAEVGYVQPPDHFVIQEELIQETKNHSPLAQVSKGLIALHQNVLTHSTGPRSHFAPTSSQYMRDAISAFGFFKGFLIGCDRLLRENSDPWLYRTILINGKKVKYDPIAPDDDRFFLSKKR